MSKAGILTRPLRNVSTGRYTTPAIATAITESALKTVREDMKYETSISRAASKTRILPSLPYSTEMPQSHVCIFEGFMDFLAYLTLLGKGDKVVCTASHCDHIVLNSVGNLKKCLGRQDAFEHIHCYLDNDLAGKKTIETICGLFGDKVVDESVRYAEYKDVNDFLRGKRL